MPETRPRAGTGNKVAPDSALLRPGATLFPSKAGVCPERPREIGAGALRSRPLRLRLRRSRPAPTTRASSGCGDKGFAM